MFSFGSQLFFLEPDHIDDIVTAVESVVYTTISHLDELLDDLAIGYKLGLMKSRHA